METTNEIQVIESNTIGSTAMMFGAGNFERAMQVAKAMASATVSVPNHLRNQPGDCLAIVMQASQWGMNPFAVAQKTHIVNGTLGYEAQLVNAVIKASGAIKGRFHYEYSGENGNLSCRVGAVIADEAEITWGEWLAASSVTTKNSPLWKTNPKQQLGYLQVKNWARQYCPGAILGVYSDDELDDNAPVSGTIDTGTGEIMRDKPDNKLPPCEQEWLDAKLPKLSAKVASGVSSVAAVIEWISSMYTMTTEQIEQVNKIGAIDGEFNEEREGK